METIFALSLFALVIVLLSFESGWNNLMSKERNDLVFNTKNHTYGAYAIRKAYGKYLALAVLITVGFATAVAMAPKLLKGSGEGEEEFSVEMSAEMIAPPPDRKSDV